MGPALAQAWLRPEGGSAWDPVVSTTLTGKPMVMKIPFFSGKAWEISYFYGDFVGKPRLLFLWISRGGEINPECSSSAELTMTHEGQLVDSCLEIVMLNDQ